MVPRNISITEVYSYKHCTAVVKKHVVMPPVGLRVSGATCCSRASVARRELAEWGKNEQSARLHAKTVVYVRYVWTGYTQGQMYCSNGVLESY